MNKQCVFVANCRKRGTAGAEAFALNDDPPDADR